MQNIELQFGDDTKLMTVLLHVDQLVDGVGEVYYRGTLVAEDGYIYYTYSDNADLSDRHSTEDERVATAEEMAKLLDYFNSAENEISYKIIYVLFMYTAYEVSKYLDVNDRTINRYQNGTSNFLKMQLSTALGIIKFYDNNVEYGKREFLYF